jgi:acetate kinase
VLNSGSSSQKGSLYEIGAGTPEAAAEPLWEAAIHWDGGPTEIRVKNSRGAAVSEQARADNRRQAVERMLDTLFRGSTRAIATASEIDVVGHRIVHGGHKYTQPTAVTSEVKAALTTLSAIAPLHNRAELEGMEIVETLFGAVSQVAVFDTGFHSQMPMAATVYPGPYEWFEHGIRRYGFHGINHQYCAQRTAQLLDKNLRSLRLVTCHLGNGCSLAAIRDGQSVDTTMGFTPLEGLMMGTRSGSLDPGILTYLLRRTNLTAQQLDELLNHESGLLGISGLSGDMREILAARKQGHRRAELAFEIYVHRIRSFVGAMIAVLGGADAIVFTAGVGENSPEVREATCANLGFLGLKLDVSKNAQSPPDQDIAQPESAVRVLIVHAQEEWAIARECWRMASVKPVA